MRQAKRSSEDWIKYWDQDALWAESGVWKANAKYFIKKAVPILNIQKEDRVLDIGCGAGHIAELLAPKVKAYTGTDTSPALLRLAGTRCAKYPGTIFTLLPADYARYETLGQFTLIICVSVIQYLRDFPAVKDLIREVSKAAAPGARFLIADLPQSRTFLERVQDAASSLFQSLREGYFFSYFRAFMGWFFSDYRKFSETHRVLELPVEVLKSEVEKMGFKAVVIRQSVSICANRPSLLVEFS